jgi:mannose-6-phosphate isomerase
VDLNGIRVRLDDLIETHPEAVLGRRVARRFQNRLPFLFKVLSAAAPLSLQAHPDREQARSGYSDENRQQIAPNDPRRNFRDENHKPECICALTPFWALCGFREQTEILADADRLKSRSFSQLVQPLRDGDHRQARRVFLETLLSLEPPEKSALLDETLGAADSADIAGPALDWMKVLAEAYPADIGALAPLFLNLVQLQPGQALRLPPGELHAYLEGTGIELMANSDNVLRGGLTPKHVDVNRLLEVLTFSAGPLKVLDPQPDEAGERVYPSQAEEFVLSAIRLESGRSYESQGERAVEIQLCIDGSATITELESGRTTGLQKGVSVLIPAAAGHYRMQGTATIYKAAIP